MTRYLILLSVLFKLTIDANAQSQEKFRFVGQVNGISKDSFEKNETNLYPSIPLPKLTQSPYSFEIRLYETDILMAETYCTIIYIDTTLKRKGFMNTAWEIDSTSKVKPVRFSSLFNLDSLFSVLIKNGIFNLEDIDPKLFDKKFPPDYSPYILTDKGTLVKDGTTYVRDGAYYFLEFKVGNLFNLHSSFINPTAFYNIYPDNQILRRQSEISLAITCGRQ
jgi:hypothetical protein